MAEETFTTKEILVQLRTQLDRIESKVDTVAALKADRSDLERVIARVDIIERSGTDEARRALAIAEQAKQMFEDAQSGKNMTPLQQTYLRKFENMDEFMSSAKTTIGFIKWLGFPGFIAVVAALVYVAMKTGAF